MSDVPVLFQDFSFGVDDAVTVMSPHSDYPQRKRVALLCFLLALCTLKSIEVRHAASSDGLALRVVAMWGHHGYCVCILSHCGPHLNGI